MLSAPNLPRQSTPFVGRQQEIADLIALLHNPTCQLVTLVGPGGIGKTRLVIEVVAKMPNHFAQGVHFVNFQPVASIDMLASTVADTLNITGREAPQIRLLNFLREKEILLVLDNLEHLLDGIEWLGDLLANAPGVKLLTTSREALKLQEEWLYPIRGLSFPISIDDSSVERYDAVQVFLQSARRVQPDFLIAQEKAGLVRICRQTEGIPLAVEMAASWVKVLSCEQIADEMQHSFNFLTVLSRNVPERHRSMRAVFDHSWRLLPENEHQVFRQLSVFHGGFTFHAAEQVAGATLPVLAALVEKSLVRRLPSGRCDMHELLRQFAAEKLLEDTAEKEAVQDRHCAYYIEFLHGLTQYMRNEGEHNALLTIEGELDNVRACWERAIEQVNIEAFRKGQETLRVFYHVQDRFHEGEKAFGRAVSVLETTEPSEERDTTIALLLIGQGKCYLRIGQHERAKELLSSSIVILRRYSLPQELGWALYDLARILHEREEFRTAVQAGQEALTLAKGVNDLPLTAWSYYQLSYSIRMYGHYSESLYYMQECVSALIKSGDEDGIAIGYSGLGERLRERGEYNRAKQIYQQGIEIHRRLNYKTKLSNGLQGMGETLAALGDYDEGRFFIEESLAKAREVGFPRRLTFALLSLGNLLLTLGDLEGAERHFQEGLMISTKTAEPWQQALSTKGLGRVALRRGQYADAERLIQESLIINQKMEFFLESATCLSDLGRIALAMGNTRKARRLFGNALSTGLETQLEPVLLEIIAGIAELFSAEGDVKQAARLVGIVLDHPASHQHIKDRVGQLLGQIQVNYSSAEPEDGEAVPLEAIAAELVSTLSATSNKINDSQLPIVSLSQRELEVLALIAEGYTNHDIADRLYVGVSTVKKHINHIYDKLSVKNRTQAVARAREIKILG